MPHDVPIISTVAQKIADGQSTVSQTFHFLKMHKMFLLVNKSLIDFTSLDKI